MSAEVALSSAPAASSRREVRVVFAGLMLVLLMAALDQTIVSTALPAIHAAYITAFTNALGTVFAVASGVAGVAFVLSWALPQRQLRDSVAAGSGIGESFAIPKHTDSLAEASRALTTLIGRERRKLFVEELAERAGVDLSAGAAWLIVRLQENPGADIAELSERFAIPVDVGRGALEELTTRGMVVLGHGGDGSGKVRRLTPSGEQATAKLVDERRASLVRLCEGWSPDQNPELGELITRLAGELGREPDAAGIGAGAPG